MWILQNNCNHSNNVLIAAFEGTRKVDTNKVYLEEPYVGWGVLAHPAYEIPSGTVGERNKKRLTIGIAVITKNRIIVEARMDIINYQ